MKMDFNWEKVDGLAKALGGRVELIEKILATDGLTPEMIEMIEKSDFRKDFAHLYGFHIDSNESDPSEAVTYLEDAISMKPAFMDYTSGEFDYGSWENAFFMPRPCMLKYDGTVDYYLDPNDYSKKEDGTASDVADDTYGGNAMMEWGRYDHQIWYKIVPDEDDSTSASIYFSDYKLDNGFHAWSFINNQGNLVKHFYTPIYNGSIDENGKLRSISGKDNDAICKYKTAIEEIDAAELNNPGEDKLWYTETFADVTLINLLLVLIGKNLNTEECFGNGLITALDPPNTVLTTGTMDNKGLFFGAKNMTTGVKIFGMENYWGNQFRRIAGLMSVDYAIKYKMTYGTNDGSDAESYNTTAFGYLDSGTAEVLDDNQIIRKYLFNKDSMFIKVCEGTTSTGYTDVGSVRSGIMYAYRGGYSGLNTYCGAFAMLLRGGSSFMNWLCGAAPSCKPLS